MTTVTTRATGNLLYTDIEQDLRSSVRSLLDQFASWQAVLARTESGDTTDSALWAALTRDLGCAGLSVPEQHGGAGASWREVAVVAEELGRSVAPVPFLGHTIAVALLMEIRHSDLLGKLTSGELTAAVALPFGSASIEVHEVVAHNRALHGKVRTVADSALADVLLVPIGDVLYLVQATADGLSSIPIVSLDMTRPLADWKFDGVTATEVATGDAVRTAVTHALRLGLVVLAAEQLGVAEKCLDMTVEYLKIRRQFGRTLGSYQALKHRLADLWVLISQARAVARYAAECAATGSPDLPVAASLAKAHCSHVVQQAADECLQMHGGIGFTWEHPAHLYLKRAKSSALALGGPTHHRALLATFLDIPGVHND